jgi:outer membrane biosynthesis protein TonB
MWPAADAERIRGEIVKARARGILSQLDGTSKGRLIKHSKPIFNQSEITPAQAILMRVYPTQGEEAPVGHKEVHVELVIDSAGKVRSVKPAGDTKTLDRYVLLSASQWKFIPAFKNGRSVASRMHNAISPLQ